MLLPGLRARRSTLRRHGSAPKFRCAWGASSSDEINQTRLADWLRFGHCRGMDIGEVPDGAAVGRLLQWLQAKPRVRRGARTPPQREERHQIAIPTYRAVKNDALGGWVRVSGR